MRYRRLLVLTVGLVACNDVTREPEPRVFTITPAEQWAGGQVTVSGFKASEDLPVLLAGADTLTIERLDDSTVRAALAATLSGSTTILRAHGNRLDSVGVVRVFGYLQHEDLPTANVAGELMVVQHAGNPWIVGQSWGGNGGLQGVTAVDAAIGTVFRVTGLSVPSEIYGVGLTSRPDAFMLRDSTGVLGRWLLWPSKTLLEPSPLLNTSRQLAQLNDSIFILSTSQNISTYNRTTRVSITNTGAVSQLRLSPSGALATFANTASLGNAPVFNARTGAIAYTIPSLRRVDAIEFSPDDTRIAAIGNAVGTPVTYLFLINAMTGETLDSTTAPAGTSYLLFDPAHPRIYAYSECAAHRTISVYSSETLVLEGTLTGGDLHVGGCTNEHSLAYDGIRERLYVVEAGVPAERTTFEILP